MSKYLLAVSGGIDSVVLLDYFFHTHKKSELIVAHFDHHLRENSHEDYLFVENLAKKYALPFFGAEAHLKNSSEESARTARYDFLFKIAKEEGAIIVTAHHLDDLVESIAINLIRGTGWRGLAVLNREGIIRPFIDLGYRKSDIYKYAAKHNLTFREDPTNSSPLYLRNRVREALGRRESPPETLRSSRASHSARSPQRRASATAPWDAERSTRVEDELSLLLFLRNRQIKIANEIDTILSDFSKKTEFSRSFFTTLDPNLADELLRSILIAHGISSTRPTRSRLLSAIKTYSPEKKFNLPGDSFITIKKSTFKI